MVRLVPLSHESPTNARPGRTPGPDGSSNVVVWGAFTAVTLAVDGYFLATLHPHIGLDVGLAVGALIVRVALYVAIGLLIEAVLLRTQDGYLTISKARRSVLHTYWVGIMLLTVLLVADALTFAFAGYHLPTAFRILLSDGPLGVVKVVDATGVTPAAVALGAAGLGLGLAVAAGLSKLSRRVSLRLNICVTRRQALSGAFVAFGALAIIESISYPIRDPFRWEREIREVPMAFAIVRPNAEIASFRVSVKPLAHTPRPKPEAAPPLATKPDIFIVIIESLRTDMVRPWIMPNLTAFARHAQRYDHAVTTGNVTHYSWYGLLCGRIPLYFDLVKHDPKNHGSAALAALRDAGYRIHLLATPDTEYQNLEAVIFGPARPGQLATLLTDKYHPKDPDVARRDELVISELNRRLATTPPGGSVYVVALDSPHYGYQWGKDFSPPFSPYAKDVSIFKDYERSEQARRAVVNRYMNSVAWVDSLLGGFFAALERSNRTNDSIVVVTGDHGEAFWEHGSGTHGSDLGPEQLEVGLVMKLPQSLSGTYDSMFSLVDVMPLVLHRLGLPDTSTDSNPRRRRFGQLGRERAAFAFQGWNERGYRFAAMMWGHRLLFELDSVDPLEARRLSLKEAVNLSDGSRAGGDSNGPSGMVEDVVGFLPDLLDEMDFIRLGGH